MSGKGNVLQGFPQVTSPIAMSNGKPCDVTQPWYQLFIALWLRSGASQGSAVSPTGMIMQFGSITLPTGWLPCNGAAVSRVIYAALFAIIGETWGPGNGTSTFNVPDFRNRFLIGYGSAGFATRGGADNFTLDVTNLPTHSHTITDPGHAHTTFDASSTNTAGAAAGAITTGGMTGTAATGITATNNTGNGDAVDFLPPYAAVIFAIKT